MYVFLVGQRLKRLPGMQETRVQSLGLGRSPGEGNGKPLQYSCLVNPMEGGAWQATVHGVTKSRTQLSDFTFTAQNISLACPWYPSSQTILPAISGQRQTANGWDRGLELFQEEVSSWDVGVADANPSDSQRQQGYTLWTRSVTSHSLRPFGLYPPGLLCPWDSPGKNIGMGSHGLRGIFLTQGLYPCFLCLLYWWVFFTLSLTWEALCKK